MLTWQGGLVGSSTSGRALRRRSRSARTGAPSELPEAGQMRVAGGDNTEEDVEAKQRDRERERERRE